MNEILVGIVSAADFDRGRGCISELSNYDDYEDWLDSRYGKFMGLALAGADASLETIALDDFLSWCLARKMRPTEAALDAYAQQAGLRALRKPLSAA